MGRTHPILFFACDQGPMAALAQVAGHYREQVFTSLMSRQEWRNFLTAKGIRLLVCGTSGSDIGRLAERNARLAAKDIGIALACVEDFPGNYINWDGAAADWLIVESEFSSDVYRSRGGQQPRMVVIPPVRYDHLRGGKRKAIELDGSPTILWAGQPETDDALATLAWLIEALQGQRLRLLFRAHPRDQGWKAGRYNSLLQHSCADCEDVTLADLTEIFRGQIHLIVTQFSSVAMEGGFHGIPALFVLLPEAGAGTLKRLKGYSAPSICVEGAGFLVKDNSERSVLNSALHDRAERERVLTRFGEVFSLEEPTLPMAVALLDSIIAELPPSRK